MMRPHCLALLVVAIPFAAQAQTVRCSAFLHERDGSWRSFEPGIILTPAGPVRVATGNRFRRGRPSAQDFIARMLDDLCERQ